MFNFAITNRTFQQVAYHYHDGHRGPVKYAVGEFLHQYNCTYHEDACCYSCSEEDWLLITITHPKIAELLNNTVMKCVL